MAHSMGAQLRQWPGVISLSLEDSDDQASRQASDTLGWLDKNQSYHKILITPRWKFHPWIFRLSL